MLRKPCRLQTDGRTDGWRGYNKLRVFILNVVQEGSALVREHIAS